MKLKVSKKTTTTFIAAIIGAYVAGALAYKFQIFPFDLQTRRAVGMKIRPLFKSNQKLEDLCPTVGKRKLDSIVFASKLNNIDNIFWGDSAVAGMHDSRLYGAKNFADVAQNGQVVYCALQEVDYVTSLNPKRVIIYLGGNDADGATSYGPDKAIEYYSLIVNKLQENGIDVIIHQIHKASSSRDQAFVKKFNSGILKIGQEKDLLVLPPLDELAFDDDKTTIEASKSNDYTYDGEHLKPAGYKLWIEAIQAKVPDF